ncbi:hypothetical protein L0337_24730 [candidate division KSB1 bacterium]|nr:hypothetical protein [candidate division KSB1 bacterium]
MRLLPVRRIAGGGRLARIGLSKPLDMKQWKVSFLLSALWDIFLSKIEARHEAHLPAIQNAKIENYPPNESTSHPAEVVLPVFRQV